ncbi:MAG TPA: ATP-binding protein, partial [Ktedonobacteraceae bacterium]|nr:ATP-binding protein [Ktedonobacteraceae bacterium]
LQDRIVGAGAICEEITTKKQVEEERKQFLLREQAAKTEAEEARQRLHDLFMQAPALICILRGKEHIFELANPNFMQFVGNRDLIGKPVSEAIPEVVGQNFLPLLNQVYATGETFVGNEFRAVVDPHNDGVLEEGYFDFVYQPSRAASGEIDGVLVYAVNVTEQVRARQAVQASQQRLALAQQAARIGTFEWDIIHNRVIWTPELEALHGLPPGTFEGTYEAWAQRVHPDDLASVQTNIQRAIDGGPAYNAEFRIVRLDGSIRWVLGKGEIHRDDARSPVRMIGINMDITERKELERRKDDFISMASHELKTPITSIKGFTQVLLKRARKSGDEESLRFLTIMDTQLNKLTKLVSDLLDVSKMQSGKLTYREERFDLDDLVRETVENIQGIVSTHQIQIEGVAHACVPGDRDRIGQVLINLLTNAIKYSPQANTVIVRVASDRKEAVVSVQDFGIGIAEIYHDKIFEQFYQVTDPEEKTYPGLGIGLYLSDEIIKRHAGRIWVESAKGAGSTFSFSLPFARDDEIA